MQRKLKNVCFIIANNSICRNIVLFDSKEVTQAFIPIITLLLAHMHINVCFNHRKD